SFLSARRSVRFSSLFLTFPIAPTLAPESCTAVSVSSAEPSPLSDTVAVLERPDDITDLA
ncbi:hypothetical protein, partial [Leucobacter japonicus]|uniref:hypothetical protein n=1 Tax=Leucobacter japonicus TaxID=1461259 RepID=UPI0019D3BC3D